MQQAVDHRVDVLVRLGRLRAAGEALGDYIKPLLDLLALLEREHAGVPQRHGPRLRELHVERPEAEVDADAAVDRLEQRRGATGEAAPPQLVRHARVLAGLRDERAGVVVADDARAQRLHAPTPAFAGVTPAFAGTTPAALGTFAFATAAASACAASSWSLIARTRCDRP